jgi:hypothetical protein
LPEAFDVDRERRRETPGGFEGRRRPGKVEVAVGAFGAMAKSPRLVEIGRANGIACVKAMLSL